MGTIPTTTSSLEPLVSDATISKVDIFRCHEHILYQIIETFNIWNILYFDSTEKNGDSKSIPSTPYFLHDIKQILVVTLQHR